MMSERDAVVWLDYVGLLGRCPTKRQLARDWGRTAPRVSAWLTRADRTLRAPHGRPRFRAPWRVERILQAYATGDAWSLDDAPSLQTPIGAWVREGMPSIAFVGPRAERDVLRVGAPMFAGQPWDPQPTDRLAHRVLGAIRAWGGLDPPGDRCPHCGRIWP